MAKIKILKNVAYSFAQHCQSGLSYLHPHVSEKFKECNIDSLCIQLYPNFETDFKITNDEPLFFALHAVSEKFFEILNKNKFDRRIIKVLYVTFYINNEGGYNCKACIKIETIDNVVFNECTN